MAVPPRSSEAHVAEPTAPADMATVAIELGGADTDGFRDLAVARAAIAAIRRDPRYLDLAAADREQLERLFPVVLGAAGRGPDPERTAQNALELLVRMAAWRRYLTLFAAHPDGFARLVGLIGASPWLGDQLVARPALADELLPGRSAARPLDRDGLCASLAETLRRCSEDESSQLIALRNFKHSCVLHILALDLEGALGLNEVSLALSDLADVILQTILARLGARNSAGELGIVAYGKLGSREMSYASDTDIVFLHADDASSDALARLARDVNRWITTPTPAGVLYETDFRLRPYGESGLLVTSLAAFREYQLNAAWTWEHQALTRARFVAGNPALARAFAELRRQVLVRDRDEATLRRDVLAMRDRILASQGQKTARFDVKHARGGIIDVEFIVQYLILRHARLHPSLIEATDNVTVLGQSASLELVPPALADAAIDAFCTYRLWMHRERLRGNELVEVAPDSAQPHRKAVMELWRHVLEGTDHA
jgi:[glutamine synthetase] adenylyltransferase / [glutamine synthetase]-adenylyl-L-tyrosine phosphorylase